MLRKLLLPVFVLGVMNVHAQEPAKAAKETPIDYHEPGSPMPRLKLVTLDTLSKVYEGRELKKINKKNTKKWGYTPATRVVGNDDLDNGGNLFLMMFNPTCGHCEDETEILKKNIGLFKKSRLVLVANASMKTYLPDFVKNHKTRDFYPQMTVGLDSSDFIKLIFQYGALPQINIYGSDRKLIKSYNGEVAIDSLKQYIN